MQQPAEPERCQMIVSATPDFPDAKAVTMHYCNEPLPCPRHKEAS